MVLREDDTQWMIYRPETVAAAFDAMNAAALVFFGAWLQKEAQREPGDISEALKIIGPIMSKIGEARQQINAGLAPNDVPDVMVHAQRQWNKYAMWRDTHSLPPEFVGDALDELAAAMAYLDERTMETGTNHPRWNSNLLTGTPCVTCGRDA